MGIQDFTMDFFSLKGKNAIVTGGNTGLGQSFALALAKAGANLFVPSIMEDDGTTKDLIEAEGVGYEYHANRYYRVRRTPKNNRNLC